MIVSASEIIRLLQQVRADFDYLRRGHSAIEVQLVHRASNAEAEGVRGYPTPGREVVGFGGAGHREFQQIFEADGRPKFRDDPILDVKGNPIANSAGDALDVVMPMHRSTQFAGDCEICNELRSFANRAGRLAMHMGPMPILAPLAGWQFGGAEDFWWATLFELAWANVHVQLTAKKQIWLPSDKPSIFLPYNIDQLRGLAGSGFGPAIPNNWLKRLPVAFVSDLKNGAEASFDATDYLLSEYVRVSQDSSFAETPKVQELPSAPLRADVEEPSPEVNPMRRRFSVALSFPGEHRAKVKEIADGLAEAFGQEHVFYDDFHKAELAMPNLDLRLQSIYKEEADLVIVFVCGKYDQKEWCGIEWRAIRSLMKDRSRPDEDVMFFRLDNGKVSNC